MDSTGIVDNRVSLVLGAGGARGLAHIGVIEVLQERGYPIAGVAGCSMGALVGGIFCAGRLPEYKHWACSLGKRDVVRLVDIAFGSPGFIKGDRVIAVLRELVGRYEIEDLSIPFCAVATDLDARQECRIVDGPLFDAIRASIAIPMLLTPHVHKGRLLVDGGLLSPVPLAAAEPFNMPLVVAVDLNADHAEHRLPAGPETALPEAHLTDEHAAHREAIEHGWHRLLRGMRWRRAVKSVSAPGSRGVMELMSRSLGTMHGFMTEVQLERNPPDVIISIPHDACAIYEFWRAEEMIVLGRQAATAALDQFEAGI